MYVLKEPSGLSFNKVGITGKIFPTDEIIQRSTFVLVNTKYGHETTIIEQVSDFIYYIVEGKGYFVIDGDKEECARGDLVVIPAGKKFTYKGEFKLLLCCTPPWNEEQEETIV